MDDPYRSSSARSQSTLRCLYCGSSHLPSDATCAACKSEVGRVHCAACGAWIAAGELRCTCGSVAPGPAAHGALSCPRCHGALKDVTLDSPSVVVHECERCSGTFLDVHDWSDLADRAAAGERLPIGHFVPLPPDAELPRQTMLAEVSCPGCAVPMERVTFGVRSRTVVDVCKLHGLWLDAGELVAILAFVKFREENGGLVPRSEAEKEEDDAFAERMLLAERMNRALREANDARAQHRFFSYFEILAAVRRSSD